MEIREIPLVKNARMSFLRDLGQLQYRGNAYILPSKCCELYKFYNTRGTTRLAFFRGLLALAKTVFRISEQ